MGKPLASRILKYFEEDEIKSVAETAAGLGTVPRTILDGIITEFTEKIDVGSDLHSTLGEVEKLLNGVVSSERIAEIMQDLRGTDKRAVWPRLSQMQETPVSNYLMKEHPQVAAYVLSKATPVAAAAVIEAMPGEMRSQVMRRMLTMKHVMDVPNEVLENVLHDELLHKGAGAGGVNIHARIADIINRMNREHMDEVFAALNEFRPKEAEKVKALLFTFDDIVKLRARLRVQAVRSGAAGAGGSGAERRRPQADGADPGRAWRAQPAHYRVGACRRRQSAAQGCTQGTPDHRGPGAQTVGEGRYRHPWR